MNTIFIVIISVVLFWWGWNFYSRRFEKIFEIDRKRPTPAVAKYDGVDYVPAKHWLVLFGHHFASIAGAGPIVGPVIACILWGWFPALVWVVLGTVFIGGIHDFGSLIVSVRQGGSSVADIASEVISRKAKIVFGCFVWLALVLVIAVFTYLCAKTFVDEPKIVLPSLGLIPVAILVGFLLYNRKLNLILVTVMGLVMLGALIVWGQFIPIKSSLNFWIFLLIIYCYIASVTPVQILLQPRDYLSSFLLFFGVIGGYLGLFISHPKINTPYYVDWRSSEGWLWPMLCVTVACGAISGFHALISSGTSSKQLPNEIHARRIGYGGMVAEGLVAVMAIMAVVSGLDKKTNMLEFLKRFGPINVFGQGYGSMTRKIFYGQGFFIAITILNAFILTTLDTATRINRYLTEELFKIKNRFLSTGLVVFLGGWLALSGKWNKIWPIFGASNQLVAALAFLVISFWLLMNKKSIRFTLVPAIFIFLTTIFALVYQAIRYLKGKDYLLFSISVVLSVLAIYILQEAAVCLLKRRQCVK